MQSINPATGKLIREYPELSPAELDNALVAAEQRFGAWRAQPLGERAALIGKVAGALRQSAGDLAALITEEMGKPIAEAEAEVEKCAWVCEYYAENAARFLAPETLPSDAAKSYVRFEPLGGVLAVMPWNFPLWQVFRFAAPALAAGNVGLLKHAEAACGSALAIEDVFRRAGVPKGVFTSLLVPRQHTEEIIRHGAIAAVTLTGSDVAGRAVAALAGRHLKKTVLELGGSDPFIVLRDADIGRVVQNAVRARIINSGQSCIAAKRFIVEAHVLDAFQTALVDHMRKLHIGDPTDRRNELGPIARADLLDKLHLQVSESVRMGARLLCGGERIPRPGFFYAPTVLGDVREDMPAFEEETFGPVAAVIAADDAEHAIRLANRSRYGLGASIWTADAARGERLAERVEAGAVFVNGIVKSDPRLPFGGIKSSGYGRELGAFGIREFVNIKTVWVGAS
jgi:succinate-semialdehyde dehydrogenase / glutarate-semialdehyde dehydrogenase